MKLDNAELAALHARATWASQGGFQLALAEVYVAALLEELGSDETSGVSVGSAAHIAELAKAALALRASGGKPKAEVKAKPEAKKAAEVKPAPVEEPKAEVKPEELEAEVKPVEVDLAADTAKVEAPEPVKAESKKPGNKKAKD